MRQERQQQQQQQHMAKHGLESGFVTLIIVTRENLRSGKP